MRLLHLGCGAALLLGLAACDLDTLLPDSGDESSRNGPSGPPVHVESSVLPPAMAGGGYDVELEASGGAGSDYVWTVDSGSLPAGLTLTESGRIQGTPTQPGIAEFTVAVTSGGRRVTESFRIEVVANSTDSYELTLVELTRLSSAFRTEIEAAIDRWQDVVTGDLASATVPPDFFAEGDCDGKGEVLNGTTIDDVAVLVEVDSIDGPGEVVGRSGPCALRGGGLPLVGTVTLDSEDLLRLVGTERLTDLLIHELGHVLGFGALWPRMGLVEETETDDPRFSGPRAVDAYRQLGGEGNVPLEAQGGDGTRESHWRESTFDNEIMTGFDEQRGVPQPLSSVTIGSLADLGYQVDAAAADPYSLPSSTSAVIAAPARGERGFDIVWRGPVRVLLPGGRGATVRIREPR